MINKYTSQRLLFIVFLLIGSQLESYSQTNFYFKQLSLKEGLSQPTAKCILYDHKGFIWIGTKSGLNRFDRHDIKSYFSKKEDKNSLPDNKIHFIAEDSLNNLWVATEGGLTQYNRKEDNFSTIFLMNKPYYAYSFSLTSGRILFGGSGLFGYDYKKKTIEEIPIKNKGDIHDYIGYIKAWNDHLWILGTRWNGLWLYNLQTQTVERLSSCPHQEISSYFIDNQNNLWISPYGKGLECYSPQMKLIAQYNTKNSQLSNDIILDIKEKDRKVWFATDGGGICTFDPKKKIFHTIKHISGDINSIPVNSILSLYLDRENNMWAGTIREGALGIREVYLKTFQAAPLKGPYGLSEKAVISLYEDNDHKLWIGTDGGGLNVMDQQQNTFKHYSLESKSKITSITGFSENELLLSAFGEGLLVFNKKNGQFRPFILVNQETNDLSCRKGLTININQYAPNLIHIFSDSIFSYDTKTKKFSTVKQLKDSVTKKQPTIGFLNILHSDERTTYLFNINNIFKLNNQTKTLTSIYESDATTFINSVCMDDRGRFWIGTTRGLVCFDPLSNTRKIETNLFQEISSIICDQSNRLWIGAQGMLFSYIINENKFAILGESDGALPNEYLSVANLVSQSGDIYMGGSAGLLQIKKEINFDNTTFPSAEIMDIQLDGISILSKISADSQLSIPWNHTSLSIKIMMEEKDIFRKKMFRFNIIEQDKAYNIESYDHTLTVHSLPPGKYEIRVSCTIQDGSWTLPIKILTISVTSPWWKSRRFIFFIILFTACSSILLFNYNIRKKEDKLKWEMKEHEKKMYEEKIRFLINVSHELRTPLTLIYAPLKRLLNNNHFNEPIQKQLSSIYKQTKQMKNIINMVLDVRKMEVCQDSLQIQPHKLNQWIQLVADDFKNEFENKNIQLFFDLDESIQEIHFDENKCEIVLSNLLMNALKFSSENTKITISTSQALDHFVRISIKDQGIGLDGIDTSKLFTRFYQGDHDRKGSGIGLSYAKMLIEKHGGRIGAITNPDQGATFYYELPVNIITDTTPASTHENRPYLNELLYSSEEQFAEVEDFSVASYSVLIVEDEPELRTFLKETLAEKFNKVYVAKDGYDAMKAVSSCIPDVIVSDIMMPRMNGYELCKKIKSNVEINHIPVILLTARNDSDSTTMGYKLGADAYLSKPFEVDFLVTIITNLLRNREQIKLRYKKIHSFISIENTTLGNTDEELLLKLNKLINDHLSDATFDVQFLIKELGMSRSSLYSKIKQLTGMGVNDYINKFRIERAIQLLKHTDLSIMEISDMLGFNSQSYFSTIFKQATGCTPSKFKEKQETE